MSEYTKQAEDFLKKTGTEFKAEFLRFGKYFDDDKEERDIYKITLNRGNRSFSFEFGQSINDSGFYWSFATSKTKNYLDRKLMNKKSQLKWHIHNNFNSDFGSVKADYIHYPVTPSSYDVLACLQKYDVGSFDDFCAEFGYNTDSRKAEKTYNAVREEFKNIQTLFTDSEIKELQEIQ